MFDGDLFLFIHDLKKYAAVDINNSNKNAMPTSLVDWFLFFDWFWFISVYWDNWHNATESDKFEIDYIIKV